MSGILSIIDKESEYSRIHSYLEFIVHPEHLDAHCERLKNGSEIFPNAFDLIKTFMTEAADGAATSKQTVLHLLAARVVKIMNLDLESIEKEIPTRFQRRLTYEVANMDPAALGTFHLRWCLRVMINYPNPEQILKDSPKDDAAEKPPNADAPAALPVVTEDVIFNQLLPTCLSDDWKSPAERALICVDMFELALVSSKYDVCEQVSKTLSSALITSLPETHAERYLALQSVAQSFGGSSSEPQSPQMALQDVLNHLKGVFDDKNKLFDKLLGLLQSDIPANVIGFSQRERIVLQGDLLPRQIISKCAAIDLVTAWFHCGGSSRVLIAKMKSLWTGAFVNATDSKSDFEASLSILASNMERLIDPLRSQLGASFDEVTVYFLRLIAWSAHPLSSEEFGNLLEKNAPGLAYLLPSVSSRMRYATMDVDPMVGFPIPSSLVDSQLTQATHARSASAAADAIVQLAGSNSILKSTLLKNKVAEYLSHRAFSDAVALQKVCHGSTDSFLASAASLQENLIQKRDNAAVQHTVAQLQSALMESSVDMELFGRNAGFLVSILTELKEIELLHKICVTFPELKFVSTCCEVSFCAQNLLKRSLRRSDDAMEVDSEPSGASSESLASALENLVVSLRERDFSSLAHLFRNWRHYESARAVCCILSHLMVYLQQSVDAIVDFMPSRFGSDLSETLDLQNFVQFLHKTRKSNPASLLKRENELKIRQSLSMFTRQLLELNPADYLAQIALGDELYRSQKYSKALRLYLSAGCVESGFWTDVGMPDAFNYVLKRVIVCLKQTKAFAAAAILGQFVSPPDWAESIRLIHDQLDAFQDTKLLHFVWELPLLEHLAHLFHQRDMPHLAQIVVSIIGRPEMNEMANPNIRKKMIYSQKKHFLLLLAQEAAFQGEFHLSE